MKLTKQDKKFLKRLTSKSKLQERLLELERFVDTLIGDESFSCETLEDLAYALKSRMQWHSSMCGVVYKRFDKLSNENKMLKAKVRSLKKRISELKK